MSEAPGSSLPRIGFIGLGGMGSRMVLRLLASGYSVTGYDRARPHEVHLQRLGAAVAASPRELAAAVDVVLSSVTDDAAVEDVTYGPQGALAGAPPGTVVIDMSAVLPTTSVRLSQAGSRISRSSSRRHSLYRCRCPPLRPPHKWRPPSAAHERVEDVDEDFSAVVRAMEESALPEKEPSHNR